MDTIDPRPLPVMGSYHSVSAERGASGPAALRGSPASPAPAVVHQADGFVVVSWWRDKSSVPPYTGEYLYEHCATQGEAIDKFNEYERGEFTRAREIGVFASLGGMPVGGRVL